MRTAPPRLEEVNRQPWQDPQVVAEMDHLKGWTDVGEAIAVGLVAPEARGRRVLDVGIGTGRTTAYMRLLTDDYVGIDYTQAMVERARAAHPDRDLRLGDARDLSTWADGEFALVMFSFNGLDAIDHADREVALREFARVLADGGHLLYSTLNKNGPSYRQPPWRFLGRWDRDKPRWVRMAKATVTFPRRTGELRRFYGGWWRQRHNTIDAGDWAIAAMPAHEYRLLVHFTTLPAALAEVRRVGLEPVACFSDAGRRVDGDDERCDADYFHVVARKPTRTQAST